MPYTIKKRNKQFCVIKETDNSVVKCHPTMGKAQAHLGALESNVETEYSNIESQMLEINDGSLGPVITGLAATNRPALPLPPISLVNIDGKEFLRVPFLKQGIFEDPRYGKLVFNKKIFAKILENHKNGISHFGVSLDIRHMPELGALAWFTSDKGGYFKEEEGENGKLLVAYGPPTSEQAKDLIKSGQYRYASAELRPNYKPTMVKQFSLSTDDFTEINKEDLLGDITMDEVILSQEEFNELNEKAEKVSGLESAISEANGKMEKLSTDLAAAQARIVELEEAQVEEEDTNEDEVAIPENVRVMLEEQRTEIQRLKKIALEHKIDAIINKASEYRDESGRGHSPVLLEAARSVLLGVPVAFGDEVVVKLEGQESVDLIKYMSDVMIYLLENLPGQVLLQANTQTEEENPLNDTVEFSTEDFQSLWAEAV